jgi:hypothetical protein
MNTKVDRFAFGIGIGISRSKKSHVDPALGCDDPSVVFFFLSGVETGQPVLNDAFFRVNWSVTKIRQGALGKTLDGLMQVSKTIEKGLWVELALKFSQELPNECHHVVLF